MDKKNIIRKVLSVPAVAFARAYVGLVGTIFGATMGSCSIVLTRRDLIRESLGKKTEEFDSRFSDKLDDAYLFGRTAGQVALYGAMIYACSP